MPSSDDATISPLTEPALGASGWALLEAAGAVVQGADQGLHFDIPPGGITLGKGGSCDIVLRDPTVSKRHLELALVGSAIRIRDLGSTNGTFVGGQRVIESLVPPGSTLELGRTRIHLQGEDPGLVLSPSEADHFGELRGGSAAMRQLYAVLERVAPRDVTVLIDGETGTGKELAARALHSASRRSDGPFVVFDCSAVAPELVEAHLFGHSRGAFTGAERERAGVFEGAHRGTLFLDELDSLPPAIQPKLLRALESRQVVRLGELHARAVDVRVIAASGQSPEVLAARGVLRRDLYFRLAVVRVTMPALRERLEDIPILLETLSAAAGLPLSASPGPALERLLGYAWPGNVRELRNTLERAIALAPPGTTCLDELPLHPPGRRRQRTPHQGEALPYKRAKAQVIARWERGYLEAAFRRCGGNLSRTAREVGLSRQQLRKLLRRHGLIEPA